MYLNQEQTYTVLFVSPLDVMAAFVLVFRFSFLYLTLSVIHSLSKNYNAPPMYCI